MNIKSILTALATVLAVAIVSCDEQQSAVTDQDKDQATQTTAKPNQGDHGHDHGHGEHDHSHGDHDHSHGDHDHSHKPVTKGPNGGKVMTAPNFKIEFLVKEDRKIQITFLDKDNKAIPASDQIISMANEQQPDSAEYKFSKSTDGMTFVTTNALPDVKHLPVSLTIQTTPVEKPARARFTVNLSDCSDCPDCEDKE